jgi:hypothetical protein
MHISLFISWFVVSGIFRLLVQGQRRSFEIGKDGGPTLFTKSFDCGTLCGLPSRPELFHLFPTFGRNYQFHKPAAPAAPDLYQTVTLQGPEIPHERRAIRPKPIA